MAEVPSKVRRERRPPPSHDQRKSQLDALCRAIDTICACWSDAQEAQTSRGYAVQSPGPRAAAGVVRHDPLDPLHTRTSPGASAKPSAFGDQTGNAAMSHLKVDEVRHRVIGGDPAQQWLSDVAGCLKLLLAMSLSDDGWVGPFDPPALKSSLRDAAGDVVRLWPANVALLIARIHVLANVARTEWPPTPKVNTVVQTENGPVKVGGRADTGVICSDPKCGRYVSGSAADPIRRIDGKPYDMKCWEKMRKRKQRSVPPA